MVFVSSYLVLSKNKLISWYGYIECSYDVIWCYTYSFTFWVSPIPFWTLKRKPWTRTLAAACRMWSACRRPRSGWGSRNSCRSGAGDFPAAWWRKGWPNDGKLWWNCCESVMNETMEIQTSPQICWFGNLLLQDFLYELVEMPDLAWLGFSGERFGWLMVPGTILRSTLYNCGEPSGIIAINKLTVNLLEYFRVLYNHSPHIGENLTLKDDTLVPQSVTFSYSFNSFQNKKIGHIFSNLRSFDT